MKSLVIAGLAALGLSAPAFGCNTYQVNQFGHQMWQAMDRFVSYAQNDYDFQWIASQADSVGELAHHIGDHGEQGDCYAAQNDFYNQLTPAYGNLDSQVDPRVGYSRNYGLVQAWRDVESQYRALQFAVQH